MRRIDLDIRVRMIWLSFPRDATVDAVVKSLPERTWDSERRQWGLPMDHLTDVIAALEPYHFQMTPRCRDFWRENDLRPEAAGTPTVAVDPEEGLTVSRLNAEARRVLVRHFDEPVWLVAELESYERNSAGHAYFEFVEREPTGQKAIATVRAVMFESTRRKITEKLAPDIRLTDGLMVRVRVRVDLYASRGAFQVVVEDVDADWIIGAQTRTRDKILAALTAEELIERNRSLPLPLYPVRVGLITAEGSDACNDFLHELDRAIPEFDVTLVPATMQGHGTVPSILRALRWFYRHADRFDVVAIVRGGGARTDLGHFDSFELGRAVCLMPLKIISGVGHHRDQCVLDFVAHSEKTPTAAAACLVDRAMSTRERVDGATRKLETASRRHLDGARLRLQLATSRAQLGASERLGDARRRLATDAQRLHRVADLASERGAARLTRRSERLVHVVDTRLSKADSTLLRASERLARAGVDGQLRRKSEALDRAEREIAREVRRALERRTSRIEGLADRVRLLDPRRVVDRGFAIVRGRDGRIVTTAERLAALDSATVELRDGTVEVAPMEGGDE